MLFNDERTEKGRSMMKLYRFKQDPKTKHITDTIATGEQNHYADALGYVWEADQASYFNEVVVMAGSGPTIRRAKVSVGGL